MYDMQDEQEYFVGEPKHAYDSMGGSYFFCVSCNVGGVNRVPALQRSRCEFHTRDSGVVRSCCARAVLSRLSDVE